MESNIKEQERVQEQVLRHLFRSNSFYIKPPSDKRFENYKAIQVMDEDKFVEILTKSSQITNKNNLLGIGVVSGSLLRELAVRGNYVMPTTEQESDWWDEGVKTKDNNFMIRLFEHFNSNDR